LSLSLRNAAVINTHLRGRHPTIKRRAVGLELFPIFGVAVKVADETVYAEDSKEVG